VQSALTAAHALLNGDTDIKTAHHLLVSALDEVTDHAALQDAAVVTEALRTPLAICTWALQPGLWPAFYDAVGRLPSHVSRQLYLDLQPVGQPVRCEAEALTAGGTSCAGWSPMEPRTRPSSATAPWPGCSASTRHSSRQPPGSSRPSTSCPRT